jgi:methyltransferase (TIGR00027 family)
MSPDLRNVSDTALWVAMYRAIESDRPDALFRDPYARRLAGPRGESILSSMPRGRSIGWPMIVRTAVMDEIILRCARAGVRTVINLAAGLDTRAYRLPLPDSTLWIDADLPDMVAYRRAQLADARAVCRHEDVDADLADSAGLAALWARVGQADEPAMVVTEGLLVYLTREAVGDLAGDLSVHDLRWWLIDLASPLLIRMMERTWQPRLRAANAPMQFAPPEGTAFFEPFGWWETEFRSVWEESLRLKRSVPLAGLWSLLGRLRSKKTQEAFRRMSGVVLLERAGAPAAR